MVVFRLVTGTKVQLSDYSDFFLKTMSVHTGIIGVIIGFYFGRATADVKKDEDKTQ